MASFTEKAEKGIKWTTLSTIINSLVKLLQVAILTRFLAKNDFGVIAIASLFIGFTDLFLDMGLSTAIIHKQKIPRNHYSSLFWINVITGGILMVILFALAPLIGNYYHDKTLIPIIILLSTNVLSSSIGRQHSTIRQKKLEFKFISILSITSSLITLAIAVILALLGFGVYSLVYSTMFSVFFPNLINLTYGLNVDKNIYFHLNLDETRPYLKIGVYQIGSRVLDYIGSEIDVFIISSTFGKDILGVYSLCKKAVIMLFSILSSLIMNVLTPLLAQLQNDLKDLQQKFIKVVKIISTISFPVFFLVASLAQPIIRTLYGDGYTEYHLILSFLSINYGIAMVSGAVSACQIALGRTDLGFYWTIYRIIASTLFAYLGSLYSIEGIALFMLICTIISILPFWYIQIRNILKIKLRNYLKPQVAPLIIAASLGGLIYLIIPGAISISLMITITIVFCLIYFFLIRTLIPQNILVHYLINKIKSTW